MKTFTFVAGAAVGYVLGTKAGREKYQQIVDGARTVRQKPAVQQAQSKIKDMVGQGTTAVANKLGVSSDDTDATTTSYGSAATTQPVWSTAPAGTSTTVPAGDTSF